MDVYDGCLPFGGDRLESCAVGTYAAALASCSGEGGEYFWAYSW
jgi:hypothetical protein